MKNIVYFIIAAMFAISCNNPPKDSLKKTNNPDNGDVLKIKKMENGEKIIFYSNDSIFSHGRTNKEGLKDGWWDYFNEEGKLSERREYKIIEREEFVNQLIYFNEEGNKIFKAEPFNQLKPKYSAYKEFVDEKTFYADVIVVDDTISLKEPFRAVCIYYTPIFQDKNSHTIIVLNNQEIYAKDEISKQEIKKDTFYSLSIETINKRWFPEDDPDYTIVFGGWFKTIGRKTITGYLSEFYIDSQEEHHERRIYFKKEIFVKDDI